MKIAWYTPFSEHSAIGHFSQLAISALRKRQVDVTVVRCERRTPEIRALPSLEDPDAIWAEDLNRNTAKRLQEFDVVIYNLGDQFDYHAYSVYHQQRVPGITILHDYIIHNALNGFCLRTEGQGGNYRGHLHAERGGQALSLMDDRYASGKQDEWWNQDIARFPLLRWAMAETLGTVTHANHYRSLVAEHIGCPTATIPLAYDAITQSAAPPQPNLGQRFTIVTIGSLNPNKRYEAVIRAIHSSALLRDRCRYRIVGGAEEGQVENIQKTVDSLSADLDVTFTGRVDRATLEREVSNAHIISCLRSPTFEGASASVIEGLQSRRPVIVSDTGCYAEIPDDLVLKVNPNREHQDLVTHLETIVNDYDKAKQRADQANLWAETNHSPHAYASALLKFIDNVLYNQSAVRITDRIADQLNRWSIPSDSPLIARVDEGMQDLFINPNPLRDAA
ncbi:MAG: glycosyltransferase family 4 protein [Planctomycetaceae bacterium]|nr:glycosyltransferase family 4 protein [Planctomycetaceae bacterium]